MKISNLFLIPLALMSSVTFADDEVFIEAPNWDDKGVAVNFSVSEEGVRYVVLSIDYDKEGSRRLYIEHAYSAHDVCTPHSDVETSVIRVNGQPVKFTTFCNQLTDTKNWYQTLTPETTAGANFVINAFKNSAKSVYLEANQYTLNATAVGFSKAWNQAGGDAL